MLTETGVPADSSSNTGIATQLDLYRKAYAAIKDSDPDKGTYGPWLSERIAFLESMLSSDGIEQITAETTYNSLGQTTYDSSLVDVQETTETIPLHSPHEVHTHEAAAPIDIATTVQPSQEIAQIERIVVKNLEEAILECEKMHLDQRLTDFEITIKGTNGDQFNLGINFKDVNPYLVSQLAAEIRRSQANREIDSAFGAFNINIGDNPSLIDLTGHISRSDLELLSRMQIPLKRWQALEGSNNRYFKDGLIKTEFLAEDLHRMGFTGIDMEALDDFRIKDFAYPAIVISGNTKLPHLNTIQGTNGSKIHVAEPMRPRERQEWTQMQRIPKLTKKLRLIVFQELPYEGISDDTILHNLRALNGFEGTVIFDTERIQDIVSKQRLLPISETNPHFIFRSMEFAQRFQERNKELNVYYSDPDTGEIIKATKNKGVLRRIITRI